MENMSGHRYTRYEILIILFFPYYNTKLIPLNYLFRLASLDEKALKNGFNVDGYAWKINLVKDY